MHITTAFYHNHEQALFIFFIQVAVTAFVHPWDIFSVLVVWLPATIR